MKIGLLLNSNGKLCSYSEKYQDLLLLNNLPFNLIDPNSETLLDDLKNCTHLLFRHSQGDTDLKIYEAIFNIAHRIFGVDCSPNYQTYWQYEDKIREYYLLKSHGFPIIDSRIFWTYANADKYLDEAEYPVIVKLPKGASSSNVVKINSAAEGKTIIKQIFNNGVGRTGLKSSSSLGSLTKTGLIKFTRQMLRTSLITTGFIKDKSEYPEWQIQKDAILFQKFLPDNHYDTRVTIIGNRALAFRRFVRKNDFRASGSGNFNMEPDKIDRACLKTAFAISKKLGFTTMAYDFIYDKDKRPNINEISYCFVDTIVRQCPGYWDEELNWHEGQNWPQYYQMVDFLGKPDLLRLE